MSEIKHMDIREFREAGFLQEANRLFFHPHGLALEVTTLDDDSDPFKSIRVDETESETLTSLLAAAREQIDAGVGIGDVLTASRLDALEKRLAEGTGYKPGDCYLSGVWDYRDDPEGIVFGDWPQDSVDKANRVLAERMRHRDARAALFGVPKEHVNAVAFADVEPLNFALPEEADAA